MKSCSISCDSCTYTIQMSFRSHVRPETSVLQIMSSLCSLLYLFPFKKLLMCHACLELVHVKARGWCGFLPLSCFTLFFWDRMFHWIWSLLSGPGWLTRKPWGSSSLHQLSPPTSAQLQAHASMLWLLYPQWGCDARLSYCCNEQFRQWAVSPGLSLLNSTMNSTLPRASQQLPTHTLALYR